MGKNVNQLSFFEGKHKIQHLSNIKKGKTKNLSNAIKRHKYDYLHLSSSLISIKYLILTKLIH